jgi:DNA-binding transcriptional LysR family regulator
MGIEVQYLVAFVAVFELRSVTAAAKRLHRSQSAISHSLSKLRAHLGDELFVAHGGQMHPTAYSHSIYPAVSKAVSLIGSLRSGHRTFDPMRDTFDLRIGMTDYEEKLLSPRLWMEIERRAAGVRMLVRSINRYAAEPMVLSGALDLAIVGNPVCSHQSIECRILYTEPYVVACSAGADASPMSLEDYLSADHLRVEVGGETFGAVDDALRVLGLARRIRCVVPTYSRVPSLIRGSSLLATHSRGVFLRSGSVRAGLHIQAPPFDIAPVEIGMVTRRYAAASTAQRWAADLVESVLAVDEPTHGQDPQRPITWTSDCLPDRAVSYARSSAGARSARRSTRDPTPPDAST